GASVPSRYRRDSPPSSGSGCLTAIVAEVTGGGASVTTSLGFDVAPPPATAMAAAPPAPARSPATMPSTTGDLRITPAWTPSGRRVVPDPKNASKVGGVGGFDPFSDPNSEIGGVFAVELRLEEGLDELVGVEL